MIYCLPKIIKTWLVHKKALLIAALLYTIALAVVSLLNAVDLPNIEIDNADKYEHAIAYSLLCLLWYAVLKTFAFSKPLLMAAGFSIFYGMVLEVLQGALTATRTPDLKDVLADAVGIVFISIIIGLGNKTKDKKI
jgi:VanZ family protein